MCIDQLDKIVGRYNKTYHKKKKKLKKRKPVDVTYIDYGVENSERDPKFKVGDHVRISKYKNIFAKGYTPNWFEAVFVIKKVKSTVSRKYVIIDLNDEEIFEIIYEKELQNTSQKIIQD